MSNNNEFLQFGIFSPKRMAVSKTTGMETGVSKAQQGANKQEFARVFSQSLHKQAQQSNVKKSAAGTSRKHNSAGEVKPTQKSRQTKHNKDNENKNAVNPTKQNTNNDRSSAVNGKKLPRNHSADKSDHDKSESAIAAQTSTAHTENLRPSNQTQRKDDDHVSDDDTRDAEENNAAPNSAENSPADVNIAAVNDGQPVAQDSPGADLADQSSNSAAPSLGHSEFAAVTVAPGGGNAGEPASALTATEAQVQTGIAQTQSSGESLGSQSSPMQNQLANSLQGVDSQGQQPVSASTDDSDIELSPPTEDTKSSETATTSAVDRPNEALLGAAGQNNATKPTEGNVDKAMRMLNDSMRLPSHSFGKHSAAQTTTDIMGGSDGQHVADNSNGQQSLKDSALFRERFFMLAQQAGAHQTKSADSNFAKLTPQQTMPFDQIVGDQRANDINLAPAAEAALANRTPGTLHMPTPVLQMSSAFGQHAWSSEVGQRVMWMVHKDLQQAQLQLNPKHLGPLEIRISVNTDQQINVHFLTHSSAVKDALDQAMPRLRDAFDQSGLNLADANVQQESHKQNREQHHTNTPSSVESSCLAENVHEEIPAARGNPGMGLSSNIVDFYA